MSLRFTDTNKWRDPWFMDLPVQFKALWQYVCDNCDNAGVWSVNVKLAEFEIGAAIDWRDALSRFQERVRMLSDGRKWYLTKFLSFQYPGGLNDRNPPHRQVLRLLASHGLHEEGMAVVDKGASKPLHDPPEGAKTRPDQTRPDKGGVGGAAAKPDAGMLLAEFGLPASPRDVAEWKGGLNKIACCRSLDEARAFLAWSISICASQNVSVRYFRHVRALAQEWANGKRDEVWKAA